MCVFHCPFFCFIFSVFIYNNSNLLTLASKKFVEAQLSSLIFFFLKSLTPINTEENAPSSEVSLSETSEIFAVKWTAVLHELWQNLKHCYSSKILLRWSIWWALSTCGWILVVNYIQNLWETILPSQGNEDQVFNGAVESAAQILGVNYVLNQSYHSMNLV